MQAGFSLQSQLGSALVGLAPARALAAHCTDQGLFTTNNVLPECHGERWCQMLYWLVVTKLCNTRSLVECSHVKTMLGQREALE